MIAKNGWQRKCCNGSEMTPYYICNGQKITSTSLGLGECGLSARLCHKRGRDEVAEAVFFEHYYMAISRNSQFGVVGDGFSYKGVQLIISFM